MAISRIDNLDIEGKHLFSGIFGRGVEDIFIDEDLRRYGIFEALYLSLKRQGYTVVFYSQDPRRNFFSFRKEDLARLYNLTPNASSSGSSSDVPNGSRGYTANINSPFGNRRRRPQSERESRPQNNAEEPDYDQIQTEDRDEHRFFRISDSVDPFMVVTNYIGNHPESKTAFIFATGSSDRYSEQQTAHIDSMFETFRITFASRGIKTRIIVLYNCASSNSIFSESDDTYFTNRHFRNKFLDQNSAGSEEASSDPSFDLYEVPGPDAKEFRNLLNRRRLKEGLNIFDTRCGLDGAALRLSQDIHKSNAKDGRKNPYVVQMSHYHRIDINALQKTIEGYDNDKAIDKLRSMKGMEKVISQLEDYIEALKFSRDSRQGARFRPHLVFSGNPGTGKTTVARLLAEILREEGLLERGHLVEATVGDLEGEYIGQTRVKTKALCERARGGVLFIDEAYGLMSGSGHGDHADYGKEAIEVLIQFMENSSDSLVILAGYKEDMENLIQNGNKGFTRRFNGKESFVQFDDYPPEALYSIFQRQIKDMAVTDEFTISIKNIIHHRFAHRTATWGNAGEMEKLASSITNLHRKKGSSGPLDVADIPDHYMRVIAPVDSIDDILKEVEDLEGLNGVKQHLRTLIMSSMGQRMQALLDPSMAGEKPNLNFVFTGAPGTGKTTVANLMAKILYTAGLINKSDKAKVVQKGDIIKSGIGDTPKAIKKLFEDHAGEVIFIDEAYGLTQHGSEAIDEITNCLTDPRYMGNQALILAGYTQEMDSMLKTNRGLRSRFEDNIWLFEDYTNDELWRIFLNRTVARGMQLADIEVCKALAASYFDEERRTLGAEFSNARKANQLFNKVVRYYNIRAFKEGVTDKTLRPQDFPNYSAEAAQSAAVAQPDSSDADEPRFSFTDSTSYELDLSEEPEERKVTDPSHFSKAVGLIGTPNGMGTGFIISVDKGLVLTAHHVVDAFDRAEFFLERGSKSSGAKVVWADPVADFAILQLESVPDDARYFILDHRSDESPALLEPIVHCGFVKGLSVSDNFQVYEGKVSGYDPAKHVNANRFDAILSDIAAINGCSGGPVMRKSDMAVIGLLQGGFEGAPTRLITDIHQLHKQDSIIIIR